MSEVMSEGVPIHAPCLSKNSMVLLKPKELSNVSIY